jgi:arsenate reductase (glutaredoxin)
MKQVTIWHNPRCTKSRQALELLKKKKLDPEVVLYLEDPPSAARIDEVLGMLGLEPRELMRKKEAEYQELGLDDPKLARKALVAAMVKRPILIERPVVIAGRRAVIGRPTERILEIL